MVAIKMMAIGEYLFVAGGVGADESVNITNEFGGQMDPQLFGKCTTSLLV